MSYYVTKKGDTWLKVCTALSIDEGDRKPYYAWISKYHGYGSVKHDDIEVPWMNFMIHFNYRFPRFPQISEYYLQLYLDREGASLEVFAAGLVVVWGRQVGCTHFVDRRT
jgi:hypothetical protein